MKKASQSWMDRKTRSVVGVDRFRARLELSSEIARSTQGWDALDGPDAWHHEKDRLLAVEAWFETQDVEEVSRTLGECPPVDEAIRKLRASMPLDEALLFRVKRLLYHCESLARRAPPHFDVEPAAAANLREFIHPQRKPGPQFRLVDELDEELEAARKSAQKARRRVRELTRQLEAEVLQKVDGRFDVRGVLRTEDDVDELPLEETKGGWVLSSAELKDAAAEHDLATEVAAAEERRVIAELSNQLSGDVDFIAHLVDEVARLDHRLARIRLKQEIDGTWPELVDGDWVRFEAARAVGIEAPQPISFAVGNDPILLMGPNMGGKSALLRLVGLASYCGHHLLPFPAKSLGFRWASGLVYIGSEEPNAPALSEGLSAFGREVRRIVDCLDRDRGALWLLDEVGRGTHPRDGAHILEEVVRRLTDRHDGLVATTHFADVSIDGEYWRIRGIAEPESLERELQAEDDLRAVLRRHMDYQPEPVSPDSKPPRDALLVARALGLELD